MITDLDLARMHEAQQKWDKAQRFTVPWVAGERDRDPRRELADQVEMMVADLLVGQGYFCVPTRHKEHFDLLVEGIRVEVKAANWDGKKYTCQLRNNQADVLVWGCFNSAAHWFVIPFGEVAGRSALKISQHDPREYVGRWTRWYGAWNVIGELVAAGCNVWQPALMELQDDHLCA